MRDHIEGQEGTPPAALSYDYDALRAQDPRLWARFWAKAFDLSLFFIPVFIYHMAVAAALSALWPQALVYVQNSHLWAFTFGLFLILTQLLILFPVLEALTISLFGTTLGKALFGIRIRDLGGRKLGLGQSIMRSYGALLFGLGLTMPLIAIFTLWFSRNYVKANGIARWDENTNVDYRSKPVSIFSWVIGLALIVLYLFVNAAY